MNYKEKYSPVVALIDHVYQHSNEAKGPSWRLLNEALSVCLRTAIHCQFKFEIDDFAHLRKYGWHYWCGAQGDTMSGEYFYSLAVNNKNRSAAIAFEAFKKRKPFMLNGERLALNSEFLFCEEPIFRGMTKNKVFRVWVTSINAEKIVFCWYDNEGNVNSGKPSRRFVLSQAELKTAQKEGRAALSVKHFTDWVEKQETPEATP